MERVEDNKKTESGPILTNSKSSSHVLDQQYSQLGQKSVTKKPLWNIPPQWSMETSYEMHDLDDAEHSALATSCKLGSNAPPWP